MADNNLIETLKKREKDLIPYFLIRNRKGEFLPDEEILHRVYSYLMAKNSCENSIEDEGLQVITEIIMDASVVNPEWHEYIQKFHGDKTIVFVAKMGEVELPISCFNLDAAKLHSIVLDSAIDSLSIALVAFNIILLKPALLGQLDIESLKNEDTVEFFKVLREKLGK